MPRSLLREQGDGSPRSNHEALDEAEAAEARRRPLALYYENIEGHGGAATNKQQAHMNALAYAFLWHKLRPSL